MSNTERLVMIPLAPHTERERGWGGGLFWGTKRESEGEKAGDTETKRGQKQCAENHTEHQNKKTMSIRAAKWYQEKKKNRKKRAAHKKEQEKGDSRPPLKGLFTCTMMINTNAPPVLSPALSPPPHPFISLCDGKRERVI